MTTSDAFGAPGPLHVETTTRDHATWITIRGEADVSNHELLQAALAAIKFNGIREVHLQLSELRFCDVRALSQLLMFGRGVRQSGRDVAVHDANHVIQTVAQLVGADGILRFE